MSRLSNILAIIAFAILPIVSCTKAEIVNPYEHTPVVKVVETCRQFNSDGGTGTIKIECEGNFNVSVDASWVHCSASGNVVNLKVDPCASITGRSATVSIICGEDVARAVVHQTGYVIIDEVPTVIETGDESCEFRYAFDAPYTMSVTSDSDWIKASVDTDQSLVVKLDENTTGWKRTGILKVSYSDPKQSAREIKVTQVDFNLIAGDYSIICKNESNRDTTVLGVLAMNEKTRAVTLTIVQKSTVTDATFDTVFPIEFSAADMSLTIRNGESIGYYNGYYLFNALVSDKGTQCYNPQVALVAPISRIVRSNGTSLISFTFKDNGVWSTSTAVGFSVGVFKTSNFANTSYAGTFRQYKNPILKRVNK